MTYSTSTSREDRLAAAKAARATWTPTTEAEIGVDQLQAGDFLVRIPSQHGVRGYRIDTTVTSIEEDWETWRHGRFPVTSRIVRIGVGTVNIPSDFRCFVRRSA
jgi:hypothetical protein